MAEVMMNAGATQMRRHIVEGITAPDLRVLLFVNNVTPLNTSVITDFVACTLSGYAEVHLDALTFIGGAAGGEDDAAADPVYQILAPYAGGVTIYGYIIYDNVTLTAIWGDVFAAPFAVPSTGAVIAISVSSRVKIA